MTPNPSFSMRCGPGPQQRESALVGDHTLVYGQPVVRTPGYLDNRPVLEPAAPGAAPTWASGIVLYETSKPLAEPGDPVLFIQHAEFEISNPSADKGPFGAVPRFVPVNMIDVARIDRLGSARYLAPGPGEPEQGFWTLAEDPTMAWLTLLHADPAVPAAHVRIAVLDTLRTAS